MNTKIIEAADQERAKRRANATLLAECGLRVLAWMVVQNDTTDDRRFRVVRGMALNASYPTSGINTGNSFAPAAEQAEHVLSYETRTADVFHPRGWVHVTCSAPLCASWAVELEPGHTDADYRRLEAMHAGKREGDRS